MENERLKLITTSIPPMNELRCIKLQIDTEEIQGSLIQSLYHRRILKCRLLIYSIPEILAAPIPSSDYNDIYVIAKAEFDMYGKMREKLSAMNIKISKSLEIKLTPKIYEACLRYTILCNVSPEWNKVDNCLLQGKYFLASLAGPTTAIKMNIDLTADSRTRLSLSQVSVNVLPITLGYFSLTQKVLQNFINHEKGFIIVNGSGSQTWVFVLPSLTRGKVISISKSIPETSSFKNYQELRKHWKNMYGYRLPETDVGIIYYQIYFPGFGDNVYTYPDCCVKSSKLKYLNLNNATDTVSQFLRDLREKVPKILGTKLNLQELHSNSNYNDLQKQNQEPNIHKMMPWIHQNIDKILNQNCRDFDTQGRSTNYNSPIATNCNGSESHRRALSTIPNNSSGGRAMCNMKRDKNLYNVLNMKSFLQVHASNRNALTPWSRSLKSVIENDCLVEQPKTIEMHFGSRPKSGKLLIGEEGRKIEEIRPTESTKDNKCTENKVLTASALKGRSSFDSNGFEVLLSEKNSTDQNLKKDLLTKEEDVHIQSPYFKDLVPQSNERGSKIATSSSKLKFHRLKSYSKKITVLKKDGFDGSFKTRDISTYFRETKIMKVLKHSDFELDNKNSTPKLIQTQLNVSRSGEIEMCVENKKTTE